MSESSSVTRTFATRAHVSPVGSAFRSSVFPVGNVPHSFVFLGDSAIPASVFPGSNATRDFAFPGSNAFPVKKIFLQARPSYRRPFVLANFFNPQLIFAIFW